MLGMRGYPLNVISCDEVNFVLNFGNWGLTIRSDEEGIRYFDEIFMRKLKEGDMIFLRGDLGDKLGDTPERLSNENSPREMYLQDEKDRNHLILLYEREER